MKVGQEITKNRINGHMATRESKVVELDVHSQKIRPSFRTQWIKVYSEAECQ
jgi:hypothetical protein